NALNSRLRLLLAACVIAGTASCFYDEAAAQLPADAPPAKKEEPGSSIEAIEQHIKELRTQYAAKPDDKLKAELLSEYAKRKAYYIKEAAEYESQRRRL